MTWLVRFGLASMLLAIGMPAALAGTVSGRIVDETGAPLAGVHVEIVYQSLRSDDLLTYGASIKAEATTSAKGRYAIDISHLPPGEYAAHAYQVVSNGGRQVNIDLVAEDASTFPGNADTVRNFTAGTIEQSDALPYGNAGIFVLQNAIMDYTDLSTAEVSLVNQETGRTITRLVRSSGEGLVVTGIPFGTYRATVTLNGKPLFLQLWGPGEDDSFAQSIIHDFSMGYLQNQFVVAARQ